MNTPPGNLIHHSKPTLLDAATERIYAQLASGQVGTGNAVTEFELTLATTTQRALAVCTNSGSSALGLALQALMESSPSTGDEVIAPSYVCSSVLNEIKRAGAKPILVDVDPATMNVTAEQVQEAVNSKTCCAILPHLFGNSLPVQDLQTLDIDIIEDCAMAIGGSADGNPIGSFGRLSIFSFYATKMITTGHGGAVTTNDATLHSRIRDWLHYDNREHYDIRSNLNMSDLNAALGISQLQHLPDFVERRRQLAANYHEALAEFEFEGYWDNVGDASVFFRYCIRVPNLDSFKSDMLTNGIEVKSPVFKPLHQYLNLPDADFPGTMNLQHHAASLPIYPSLTDEDQHHIITAALSILKNSLDLE